MQRTLLLVDDAELLPPDVQRFLSELVVGGAAAVLTVRPSPSLVTRVPLALQARASGVGLVLGPRAPADGDLFGVRLDADGGAVPGRGHAVHPSGTFEVQIALAPSCPMSQADNGVSGRGATAFVRPPILAR